MQSIKNVPWKIWAIISLSYLIPFLIEDLLTSEGIREMRWFLYVVPVFFFAYYFGLRGGVLSSFLSNAFFLLWEWKEALDGEIRPPWETYLIFAISLVSFSIALGIGILANKLSLLSIRDPLTRLFNRRYIQQFEVNKKLGEKSILFIDLDRFKLINDSLGHLIGDQILQSVAKRLKRFADEQKMVARLGGDEFLLILSEVSIDKIKRKADAILQALSKPFFIEGHELYLTASIGISQSPNHGQNLSELIAKADIAMYQAKDKGKNRYQLFEEEMNTENLDRFKLEKDLHQALNNDEMLVYFQPRVHLTTKRIVGVEALVRWQHPTQGLIDPMKFIPIAEETGLIVSLGEKVLYAACRQNKEWQDAGFIPLRISVNISARQFQPNLVAGVKNILKQTGLAPEWLELEITESMLMKNVEEAIQILHQLKKLGVHLSIDDFGTGYSSLSYLKRFPIDCLKIDQSFVHDVVSDASITEAIIILGHNLNLELVAEGVEEQEQSVILQAQNCHYGQGYLFSRPVPRDEFEQLMKAYSQPVVVIN